MKRLLWVLALACALLVVPLASGLTPPTGGVSYYNFSSTTDLWGSDDLTNNGAASSATFPSFSVSGNSSPNSFNFVETQSDYLSGAPLIQPTAGAISVWVDPDNAVGTSQDMIIAVRQDTTGGGADEFRLGNYNNGNFFAGWVLDGDNSRRISTTESYPATTWVHMVVTWNESTGTQLWWNNQSIANTSSYSGTSYATYTHRPYIGDMNAIGVNEGSYWDGGLDEVKFFDYELSREEISNLYAYGSITAPTNVTFNADSDQIIAAPTYNVTFTNGTDTYTYTGRTGTITTEILSNTTSLWNVTVNSTDHYIRYANNQDLSSGSLTLTLTATDKTVTTRYEQRTPSASIGNAYTNLASFTYAPVATTTNFITAVLQTNASVAATAQCRVLVDGSPVDSTSTRTLSAGTLGNFYLTTGDYSTTLGSNVSVQVQCRKTAGGNYLVDELDVQIVSLHDEADGKNITKQHLNTTGAGVTTTYQSVYDDTFTTADYNLSDNRNLAWIFNYRSSIAYGSTANATIHLVVNDDFTVCENLTRYGTSGSTGSVGNACFINGLEPNTTYNVSLYASTSTGTATINDFEAHAYEVVLPVGSINETIVEAQTISTSNATNVVNVSINNPIGGSYTTKLVGSINLQSTAGTQDAVIRLGNGVVNLTEYRRTINNNGAGNIVLLGNFNESGVGTSNYKIWVTCPAGGCTVQSAEITAYIVNQQNITPDEFVVTAYDGYNLSALDVFNATLSGSTFTTTNGTITIPSPNPFENITVSAPNHFDNVTLNHDATTDLNASLLEYTRIYATNLSSGSSVTGFTVLYDGTNYTATGEYANIPLYDETASVRVDADGFSLNTQNLTADPYLQNATFRLYLTNTINVTFKDETTREIINTTTITAYFTGTDIAYNYTTTNGTLFEELLSPDDYVVTYSADGYDQREYVFTLTNRTYNELTLYLQNSTSTVTVVTSVRDRLGNEVENAIVKAQRKNLATGEYYEVEACTTDNEGTCFLNLVEETVTYRFLVITDDTVRITTSDKKFYDTDGDGFVSYTIVVTLTTDTNEQIAQAYDVSGSVTYDDTTQTFTYTWNDANNLGVNACLKTTRRIKANSETLDYQCSETASGSLTYSINESTGDEFTSTGTVEIDGVTYTLDTVNIQGTLGIADDLGGVGLFIFAFFIALTAAFTGLWNPVVGPTILVASLWLLNLLGLIAIGTAAVGSLGALLVVMILMVRT